MKHWKKFATFALLAGLQSASHAVYVGGNPLILTDPEGLAPPGTWQTVFNGVRPPIPTSPGVDISSPSSQCVKDYLQNYYGNFVSDTLVPGFSAISYVPGSGYASTAWQTTAVSGGAKAAAAVAIPAYAHYTMWSPGGNWNLGVNLLNGSTVAASAVAVGGAGASGFATSAHVMAIAACSCRKQ
jgi:hypothetical protein